MGRVTVTTNKRSVDILGVLGIFSAFLLLTLIALYFGAPIVRTKAVSEAPSADVEVLPVASISVDPTVTLSITPSAVGATASQAFDVKVMTNAEVGYKLQMAAKGSSADMTSKTSSDTIKSDFSGGLALDDFSVNKWGYSKNGSTFYAVPVTGNEVTLENPTSSTANAWATHTYYFGAKVDSTIQAGVYQKEVVFTATANPRPRTFYDITYMHEMSSAICSNTPTASSYDITAPTPNRTLAEAKTGNYIAETTLVDKRDMKSYVVRKYANGECWMAQNLETDFFASGDSVADGIANTGTYATNTTTRVNTDATGTLGDNNLSNWISYSDINDNDAFTSTLNTFYATQNVATGTGTAWADNGRDGAHSFSTPGSTYKNYVVKGSGTSGDVYYNFADADAFATGEGEWQRVGNYYNFAAAKAGYIGTATGGEGIPSTGSVPDNSICPRHWTLPNIGSATDQTGTKKSFGNLIRLYYQKNWTNGANNIALYNWLNGHPLDFWRAGNYYRSNGTVSNRLTNGYWWSRNASTDSNGNYLYTYLNNGTGYVNAQDSNYRGYGFSIRCVVR